MNRHTYLLLVPVCALLAFGLQQAACALRPWVGMGAHNTLVAVDHALISMILGVGRRQGGLMGGVGVVLGLVPRWGNGHRQARAGVSLARRSKCCVEKEALSI